MTLLNRVGIDFDRRMPMEKTIDWAAAHDVRLIDIQLDTGANRVIDIDDARASAIRAKVEKGGVTLRLHTLSAVNVAEYSPFLSEAVDDYMRASIDVAPKLGAAVHYLAHTVEEWHYYYEAIHSPAFALSFTANHAHLKPDGVEGFADGIPLDRVAEVRLADCFRNGHEQHLLPGKGNFDFGAMIALLEKHGFKGHYMNAFGTVDDMQKARHDMVRMAEDAMAAAP
jgi:sugar phosphate isomerase/epimerase